VTDVSESKKSRLKILYRTNQIHHKIATEAAGPVLPVIFPMAEILIITTTFTLIKFHNSVNTAILVPFFFVGIVAGIMLKLGIQFAVSLTTCSRELSQLGSTSLIAFSKVDKQFFRSCYPLKRRIGATFTLVPDTFIRILNDVVMEGVINLLVAY